MVLLVRLTVGVSAIGARISHGVKKVSMQKKKTLCNLCDTVVVKNFIGRDEFGGVPFLKKYVLLFEE